MQGKTYTICWLILKYIIEASILVLNMYYLNGGNNNCDMICSMEAIDGKCELEIQAKLGSKKQRNT